VSKNIFRSVLLCAFLGVFALGHSASVRAQDSNPKTEDAGGSLWYKGNRIELRTSDESRKFEGDFRFSISDAGDLHLVTRETRAGKREAGEIIVLFSGVMIARGVEVDKEWAVSAIDGPALATQLALKLLHLAFPDGPTSVGENSPIRLQETERSVTVSTPTSDGMLMAPWAVEGSASRKADGSVTFDMVAQARRAGGEGSVILPMAGSWKREAANPALPDAMSLDGWRVFVVAPLSGPIRGERELNSGALASDAGIHTLGELRRAIAALSR